MILELRIDELLLDEPWRDDRDAMSEALSAHLSRLAEAAGEQLPHTRDSLHIEHLIIDAPPGTAVDDLAAQVAEQIWSRMKGRRR